ncbi:uncharacterized protein [Euwallacea similis]|uniref:uncharacterized protein n=1 Tax=Euwallacea similis TaxID=1736056 RepID=UPI0034509862
MGMHVLGAGVNEEDTNGTMARLRNLRCLQINLDRKRVATDLLFHTIREQDIDVVLGQEPNKALKDAIRDRDDDAFIWLKSGMRTRSIHKDRGFVAVELGRLTLVSVYFSPNKSTGEFKAMIDRLDRFVADLDGRRVLIAGDLNAKCAMFGSDVTNAYGRVLEEFVGASQLTPLNIGAEWMIGNKNGRSVIDVTIGGATVARTVREWRVERDIESGSGHRYITYRIVGDRPESLGKTDERKTDEWIITVKGLSKLNRYVSENVLEGGTEPDQIVREIGEAFNECLLRKNGRTGSRKAVY